MKLKGKKLAVVVALGLVGLVVAFFVRPTSLERYLNSIGRNVRTHYVDLFPDYSHYAVCETDSAGFTAFQQEFQLAKFTDKDAQRDDAAFISWRSSGRAPDWWTPSPDLSDTYFRFDGDHWIMGKLEGNRLYVYAGCH